jgi:hypothetical protein
LNTPSPSLRKDRRQKHKKQQHRPAGCSSSGSDAGDQQPAAWAAVMNDDIAFRPGDLARLSYGVTAHAAQFKEPKHGFLSFKYTFTDSAPRQDWVFRPPLSAFAMTSSALHKWGLFDENFWPAFKEVTS